MQIALPMQADTEITQERRQPALSPFFFLALLMSFAIDAERRLAEALGAKVFWSRWARGFGHGAALV
ncbi:MAG: hypothetical protein ACP5E5_09455 [Acidobacteriaceae bacterium]